MSTEQQQQAWQRQQQAQQQPWNNLARYMDIINGASSGYGTSQDWRRAASTRSFSSPALSAGTTANKIM